MTWYTMFYEKGPECLYDGNICSPVVADNIALKLAIEGMKPVKIFKGKGIGKLWKTINVNVKSAD